MTQKKIKRNGHNQSPQNKLLDLMAARNKQKNEYSVNIQVIREAGGTHNLTGLLSDSTDPKEITGACLMACVHTMMTSKPKDFEWYLWVGFYQNFISATLTQMIDGALKSQGVEPAEIKKQLAESAKNNTLQKEIADAYAAYAGAPKGKTDDPKEPVTH